MNGGQWKSTAIDENAFLNPQFNFPYNMSTSSRSQTGNTTYSNQTVYPATILSNASHEELMRFGNQTYLQLWEKNIEMKHELTALR